MVSKTITFQDIFFAEFFFMRYDSSPPKYTTFYHLVYVVRWSPFNFRVFLFLKNKIKWGTSLPHRQGGEKLYI
jgi:hypothetical protein